jgi:molecular chaperone GrpE
VSEREGSQRERATRTERTDSEEPKVVVRDRRRIDPVSGEARPVPAQGVSAQSQPVQGAAGESGRAGRHAATESAARAPAEAELGAVRAELAERTSDLQRITAEYANYRKRVDRDRTVVAETATGAVLAVLLPVLDDIERARQHGDLTGAFKAVADQLETTLEKLGLKPFGAEGDRFDPAVHDAVAHQSSPDVSEPTCVAVLRRGYRHGDRLLRAALVAVADPAPAPVAADAAEVSPTDLEAELVTDPVTDAVTDPPAEAGEERD